MNTEMALAYYPLHILAYAMLPALVHVPIDGDRHSGLCSPPRIATQVCAAPPQE